MQIQRINGLCYPN